MFHNHLRFLVPNPLPYVCLIVCRNIFSADSPGPALSCANLCGENLCCRHIITQSWGPPLWVPCHHKLGSQGMGALLFLQHAPRHSELLWTFLFVCFRSSGLQVFSFFLDFSSQVLSASFPQTLFGKCELTWAAGNCTFQPTCGALRWKLLPPFSLEVYGKA